VCGKCDVGLQGGEWFCRGVKGLKHVTNVVIGKRALQPSTFVLF